MTEGEGEGGERSFVILRACTHEGLLSLLICLSHFVFLPRISTFSLKEGKTSNPSLARLTVNNLFFPEADHHSKSKADG